MFQNGQLKLPINTAIYTKPIQVKQKMNENQDNVNESEIPLLLVFFGPIPVTAIK